MNDALRFDVQDDIATLSMDDGKANAFGPDMIAAMCDGFDRAAAEAKVLVLKGRAGVFCGGFDLKIMAQGGEAGADMVMAGAHALMKFYLHPQPVVMACTGHAIAAGALLLLTADQRVGAQGNFRIGLNETSIAMTLPVFGVELARDRLDPRALTRSALNATLFGPEEAVKIGYLDQVVEGDTEAVYEVADQAARHFLTLDAKAFTGTKKRLRQATVDKIMPTIKDSGVLN